ncbi:unnamed protein product [Amoebophrya sp. A25]|nr:unnamed protein product [Amoebophrya sp. A25]|eukprot:GSA25T00011248001.1
MVDHETARELLDRAYGSGEAVRNEISGFVFDRPCEGGFVDSGNLQYGEVTVNGMAVVFRQLKLRPGDTFYDLGSGVGKLPLYCYLRSGAGFLSKSIGVEVGERRHELALMAKTRLRKVLGFNHGALLQSASTSTSTSGAVDVDSSSSLAACGKSLDTTCSFEKADISTRRYLDANVVVLSNLLMDGSVQKRTLDQLFRCPCFRRLATVRVVHHPRLHLNKCVHVECTWARVSSWHIYDVLPATQVSKLPRSFLIPAQRLKVEKVEPGEEIEAVSPATSPSSPLHGSAISGLVANVARNILGHTLGTTGNRVSTPTSTTQVGGFAQPVGMSATTSAPFFSASAERSLVRAAKKSTSNGSSPTISMSPQLNHRAASIIRRGGGSTTASPAGGDGNKAKKVADTNVLVVGSVTPVYAALAGNRPSLPTHKGNTKTAAPQSDIAGVRTTKKKVSEIMSRGDVHQASTVVAKGDHLGASIDDATGDGLFGGFGTRDLRTPPGLLNVETLQREVSMPAPDLQLIAALAASTSSATMLNEDGTRPEAPRYMRARTSGASPRLKSKNKYNYSS